MTTLDDAIILATVAHRGQLDKAGEPYILHPLRVMLNFSDLPGRMVAVLHDVVEDTSVTLAELGDRGYPQDVIDAVDALSRRKGAETYMEFVGRAKKDPLAKRVKVADIVDNMSRITPELAGLERRYTKALIALSHEILK